MDIPTRLDQIQRKLDRDTGELYRRLDRYNDRLQIIEGANCKTRLKDLEGEIELAMENVNDRIEKVSDSVRERLEDVGRVLTNQSESFSNRLISMGRRVAALEKQVGVGEIVEKQDVTERADLGSLVSCFLALVDTEHGLCQQLLEVRGKVYTAKKELLAELDPGDLEQDEKVGVWVDIDGKRRLLTVAKSLGGEIIVELREKLKQKPTEGKP